MKWITSYDIPKLGVKGKLMTIGDIFC